MSEAGYAERIAAIRHRWRSILLADSADPLVKEAQALLLYIARLEVDAEVGKLVHRMRRGSSLTHVDYCPGRPDWIAQWNSPCVGIYSGTDDLVEALRAIERHRPHD